ncbi:BZ3500_MvSof-1268-A1-R1_Chr10-4g03104 [Microbotryum saponariae]|uniref:BZ3500_MvSof-1268-A1-R1_Chr10-4g03104 protein n=1 Tax=Microbotryum saponariae TaxID=289078 RepID=A0A2X0M3R0_9BASI|nr:BZ3501_MvSof-1269-A2-R1_Chr10-2g02679 [Microbotryum saponariae]SDA01152.1 BZ3500_MvSof-1268-A1-R1_Chr10-4g03104 [Microbotryum saponariae]
MSSPPPAQNEGVSISICARDPTRTLDDVPKTIPLSSNRQLRKSIGLQPGDDDATNRVAGSVPLTLPAILRHSKTKVNSGTTRSEEKPPRASTSSGKRTEEISGKRRRRRFENAQLAGNPHITRPSRIDLFPGPVPPASTTFVPPPKSFSRSVYVPRSTAVDGPLPQDPSSTTLGAFSLSLRGLRREIRAMSGRRPNSSLQGINRTEELVNTIESQLHDWLSMSTARTPAGYYHVSPTSVDMSSRLVGGRVIDATPVEDWSPPSTAIGARDDDLLSDLPTSSSRRTGSKTIPEPPASITETLRSPSQLVWSLPSPHARYLLHAVARYYRLHSFSRAISPLDPHVRVTHVLRTTMLRPTVGGFDFETPPATDLSEFSATSASEESDATSSVHGDDEADTGSEYEYAGDETFETIRPQVWTAGSSSEHEEAFVTDDEASTTDDGGLTESESISSSIADLAMADSVLVRPTVLPYRSSPLNGAGRPSFSDARPSRSAQRARTHNLSDSSPSHSPDRQARPIVGPVATFGAARAGDWALPTRSFVDFLYA